MDHARTVVLMLALSASTAGYSAAVMDECPAEKYKPCVTFNTSRSIEGHTPLIENAVAGFVRSRGRWSIHVGYGPTATCAKVSLMLDMGPLDLPRTYERVFRNGRGVIGDSGTFVHRVDEVESGLRILTSRCRVPGSRNPERLDAEAQERLEWEAERERLEWEAERERLASEAEAQERLEWEAERERLALEEQRERLALEAERKRLDEESRRAQAQLAHEQELKRQRLAQEQELERQRLAREQEFERQQRFEEERTRLMAQLRREQRERSAQLQRERQDAQAAAQGSALDSIITGFGLGALVGSVVTGDDAVFDAATGLLSHGVGSPYAPSAGYATAGSGCEQIGERLARKLESLSAGSMCSIYSGTAEAYSQARNELAATGCASSQELVELDQAIVEARSGARSACE